MSRGLGFEMQGTALLNRFEFDLATLIEKSLSCPERRGQIVQALR
jgi:hypothetical protein